MKKKLYSFLMILLVLVCGCTRKIPQFSSVPVIDLIDQQCAIGPRHTGGTGIELMRDLIRVELKKTNAILHEGVFEYDYEGKHLKGINFTASFFPRLTKRIMLITYYDTTPQQKENGKPCFGANLNASGVSMLLSIGKILGENETPLYGVDLVFLDACIPFPDRTGSFGTKFFLSDYSGVKPVMAIYLDRIAGKEKMILKDSLSFQSFPSQNQYVWNLANALDENIFTNDIYHSQWQDLNLFIRKKFPVVHLSSPSTHDFTEYDNLSQINSKTIQSVGRILVFLLYSNKEIT